MSWHRRGIIVDGIKLDRTASKRVLAEAYKIAKSKGRRRLSTLGSALAIVILSGGLMAYPVYKVIVTIGFGGLGLMLGSYAVSGAGVLVAVVMLRPGLRWFNRKEMRLAMRELGYKLCTNCGYWLKGLGEEIKHCPECGWRREASVNL